MEQRSLVTMSWIVSGTSYPVTSEVPLNAILVQKTQLQSSLITALRGSDINSKTVKLTSTEPCDIYYTTDGSKVTKNSNRHLESMFFKMFFSKKITYCQA